MARDCAADGHVLVDDDVLAECLACSKPLSNADKIGVHVTRTLTAHEFGEGHDPRSIATPGHW